MQEHLDAIACHLSCPETLGRILLTMINDGSISRTMEHLLQSVADNEPQGLRETNSSAMILHRDPRFLIHLRRFGGRSNPALIGSRIGELLQTPGGPGVSVFNPDTPIFVTEYRVANDGARLVEDRQFEYAGEVLIEDPHDPVIRAFHSDGQVWMLRLNYGEPVCEARYYDAETLQFAYAVAAQGVSSSLVTLCQVFGASRDGGALPYLKEMATNPAYFVRWAAIQAMGKIDGDLARAALLEAQNDAHPAIRSAAQRTLVAIGATNG